jgi:hypothetical protein
MFFAYDTPDDYEPLVEAGRMLKAAGYTMEGHIQRAYVLCGYRGDTLDKAEKRLIDTLRAGFYPMAMIFKDREGSEDRQWQKLKDEWIRPPVIFGRLKSGEIML